MMPSTAIFGLRRARLSYACTGARAIEPGAGLSHADLSGAKPSAGGVGVEYRRRRACTQRNPARGQRRRRGEHRRPQVGQFGSGGTGQCGNQHRGCRDNRDGAQHAVELSAGRRWCRQLLPASAGVGAAALSGDGGGLAPRQRRGGDHHDQDGQCDHPVLNATGI